MKKINPYARAYHKLRSRCDIIVLFLYASNQVYTITIHIYIHTTYVRAAISSFRFWCVSLMRHDVRMRNVTPQQRCVGRHAKQGKTCAIKGAGPKCSTLKRLVSLTACQGKAAVCQGLKVLSPDIFAPQRHPNLYRHPGYSAEGIPLPRVLCRR